MTDYCTKNVDKGEFDTVMLATGLCVEDEEGNVVPASSGVLLDRIGPITIGEVTYPEYYANIRLLFEPSEEQVAVITQYAIDPSQPQYRSWL